MFVFGSYNLGVGDSEKKELTLILEKLISRKYFYLIANLYSPSHVFPSQKGSWSLLLCEFCLDSTITLLRVIALVRLNLDECTLSLYLIKL